MTDCRPVAAHGDITSSCGRDLCLGPSITHSLGRTVLGDDTADVRVIRPLDSGAPAPRRLGQY